MVRAINGVHSRGGYSDAADAKRIHVSRHARLERRDVPPGLAHANPGCPFSESSRRSERHGWFREIFLKCASPFPIMGCENEIALPFQQDFHDVSRRLE